jgi:hypothetical protein
MLFSGYSEAIFPYFYAVTVKTSVDSASYHSGKALTYGERFDM